MRRISNISPEFVEFIPKTLKEGVLYISEAYATASHNCPCGCGTRVVTPLTPTDWQVTVEGNFVSLFPSIGNWDYQCRSHYWIKRNQIVWAPRWSRERIAAGRSLDRERKEAYFEKVQNVERSWFQAFWGRVRRWLSGSGS